MHIRTYYMFAFAGLCLLVVVWLTYVHNLYAPHTVNASIKNQTENDVDFVSSLSELEQELSGYFLLEHVDQQSLLAQIMNGIAKSGLTLESCMTRKDNSDNIGCSVVGHGNFAQVLLFFDTLAQSSSLVIDDYVFDQRDDRMITMHVGLMIPKKLLKK